MPDEPTPGTARPGDGSEADDAAASAVRQPDKSTDIQAGMSETQIRAAGLAVDVPFESGEPQPGRLKYADLGKGWTPPEGWPPEQGQQPGEPE